MGERTRNWLLIGAAEHWETALSQPVPIWGLTERYGVGFQVLTVGDILWFYATTPVRGVIGLGIVKDKYIDNVTMVWPPELEQKRVIWPLRFRIQVLKVVSMGRWKADNIRINDLRLNLQTSLLALQEEYVEELVKRSEKVFGEATGRGFSAGATIAEPLVCETAQAYATGGGRATPSHRDLQEKIAEIGKLQFYHTQLEYPIELPGEDKNLDVVWKREIAGAPTFAFEVELSGVIEKAIMRLRFAYKRWNSRPRIIVLRESAGKVNNIIAAEDREFAHQLRVYEPVQLVELLDKKLELKTLEQALEIY